MAKNVSWNLENEQDNAFKRPKKILVSKRCLVYYDVKKSVIMQEDFLRLETDAASF